ncbi:MAG: 2-dehydropantoate 2-reductase, partial [Gammaproteobacteria bacterium]|nr:2-dehydropantoate 2-reductase [Gammaproteobacteria bacterium]
MADLFDPRILIVGAGAIGASVAGFVAAHDPRLVLHGRGAGGAAIAAEGVTLFRADRPDEREVVRVPVVGDLDEARDADVVVFAVKTFQLEEAARQVKAALGDRPVVVGLQNGVANQRILPRFFPQVVYGVVCYNAWTEAPGVVAYQKRGPIVLRDAGGHAAAGGGRHRPR